MADLKAEIIRRIRGESSFPEDVLAELIRENETKCLQLEAAAEQAKKAMVETESIMKEPQRQHDEILSFADLYDSAGIEAKKMVVSAMIRRVEVSRDYQLTIYSILTSTSSSTGWIVGVPFKQGVCEREVCMQG